MDTRYVTVMCTRIKSSRLAGKSDLFPCRRLSQPDIYASLFDHVPSSLALFSPSGTIQDGIGP